MHNKGTRAVASYYMKDSHLLLSLH